MISIVLIEPRNSGNVGAISRAMANFELKQLVLINPKCNHLSQTARNRAKHSQQILKNAKIADFSVFKRFDYIIGTTAKLGRDYNIPRIPMTAEKLGSLMKGKEKARIGLVLGREASGLTNKEVQMCDFIVHVPSSKKYPTMNISHAASILFYELFRNEGEKNIGGQFVLATKNEKDVILKQISIILKNMDFTTKEKKDTQKKIWKRVIGKAFLTKREAFAVIGFFKKLK